MWYLEGSERSLSGMFDHCTVEVLRMRWLKRDLWKAGIAIAGMLLLLVLMVWVPVSAAGLHEMKSGLAAPVTVTMQTTSTGDATVTALDKEKLAQEVQQLKNQNEPDLFGWFRTNATIFLSTLVVVVGALFGFWRWRVDRRDAQNKELEDRKAEREKRVEERFQAAVTGLGDEKEGARIGAAILLRTFLRPGYEQFYIQTFDLAVANLRLPRTSHPSEDPDGIPHSPEDPNTPLPLTTLSQALIVLFKEAFPLARSQNIGSPQSLDASRIQLGNAYLSGADLEQVWMPQASLQEANLGGANLSGVMLTGAWLIKANLHGANLSEADLHKANLSEADLIGAKLSGARLDLADLGGAWLIKANLPEANLIGAKLSGARLDLADLGGAWLIKANLHGANLSEANLSEANLNEANLSEANLSGANLSGANLIGANLSDANLHEANLSEATLIGANLNDANLHEANLSEAMLSGATLSGATLSGANLSKANLEDARSLEDTYLRGVNGLTKELLEVCKAKGAIIDEVPMASSSQAPASPPSPSQSTDAQTPSATPAQVNTSTPDTDESCATSSSPSGS